MNKSDIADIIEREEELFDEFLKKHSEGKSMFDDSEKADIINSAQKNSIVNFDDLWDEAGFDKELSVSELVPKLVGNPKKHPNFAGKLSLFMRSVFDTNNIRRVSVIVMLVFFVGLFVANVITPSKKISEKENRTLAQLPVFSFSTLADGSFMKGFEDHISDQFILRNFFVSAKRKFEVVFGKKENHGILFAKNGYLIENSSNLTRENIESNLNAVGELAKSGRYNVRMAIVPTAYEIMNDYLPKNSYINVYGNILEKAKKTAKTAGVELVDVRDGIKQGSENQLYYRTDHHQTAHGSYYLYSALAESLSYNAHPRDSFKIEKVSDSFYGTGWSNSGFAPAKPDYILKYTLDNGYECTVDFPFENKTMDSLYSEEMLNTKDKYAYYIDGNHGITEIKSTCPNGKRIAVVKDSYAHSLVPFLVNHYSRIYLIDLRYYNGDIFEYLYSTDVRDVLVLYNQNTFMTDSNLSKISGVAQTSPYNKVSDIEFGIVPELPKVDNSYFDDAVFVGDSLTMGISYFAGFNSRFLCMTGMSTKTLLRDPLDNGKTVIENIKNMDHVAKIYIMLGINEAVYEKSEEFAVRYSEFIDNVREYFPNVMVYIQSIMPVSKKRSDTSELKNHMLEPHNLQLKRIAAEKGCYYIDLNSYFAGEDGYLPDDFASDGIHPGPEKYRELAEYLKTHAIDTIGIATSNKSEPIFEGGTVDTGAIGDAIAEKLGLKDSLSRVNDELILSGYGIDKKDVLSASLYISGGATADEVAVFETNGDRSAMRIEELAKQRVNARKKDFESYLPAEMPKLNNPLIIRKGSIVVVCIADSPDEAVIRACIK